MRIFFADDATLVGGQVVACSSRYRELRSLAARETGASAGTRLGDRCGCVRIRWAWSTDDVFQELNGVSSLAWPSRLGQATRMGCRAIIKLK